MVYRIKHFRDATILWYKHTLPPRDFLPFENIPFGYVYDLRNIVWKNMIDGLQNQTSARHDICQFFTQAHFPNFRNLPQKNA